MASVSVGGPIVQMKEVSGSCSRIEVVYLVKGDGGKEEHKRQYMVFDDLILGDIESDDCELTNSILKILR